MNKRILVTGGTGYIGSHTVVELVTAGYDVVIADNYSNSKIEVCDAIEQIIGSKIPFVTIDVANPVELDALFEKYKPSGVIHFAAFKSVNESVENPLKYYTNNIGSLATLLEVCLKHQVHPFVFSSSCSVYGDPDTLPVSESAPLKEAQSPYAYTKQIGEKMLRDVTSSSGLEAIILRYFNPVGAHESALIGELPLNPPTNLVPVITQTAIGIRKDMLVFGDDYDTRDGSCIRDYIHVVDIAKAHVIALNRLLKHKSGPNLEIFNLGTGDGNTVLEVISSFEKTTGEKLNFRIAPRRAGDVVKVYSDTKLANKVLGWTAELTLDTMLTSAWKWELALQKKKSSK